MLLLSNHTFLFHFISGHFDVFEEPNDPALVPMQNHQKHQKHQNQNQKIKIQN